MVGREKYDGPDLEGMERKAREVGQLVGPVMPEGAGFCLFVFSFGEGGWMTHVSNADRADLLRAMVEFVERLEATVCPKCGATMRGASGEDSRGRAQDWYGCAECGHEP